MSFESSEIINIARFLAAPKTPQNLLKTTLDMILNLSIHSITSTVFFTAEKYAIFDELIKQFEKQSYTEIILSILVNISATSDSLSARIIEYNSVMTECAHIGASIKHNQNKPISNLLHLRCAQLLANVSRHFPEKVVDVFNAHWKNYIIDILGSFFNLKQNFFFIDLQNSYKIKKI